MGSLRVRLLGDLEVEGCDPGVVVESGRGIELVECGGMADPDPQPRPKPSVRAAFSNWSTYDAAFGTKLRMVVSNNLIKIRKRQDCCGNHGQPGC